MIDGHRRVDTVGKLEGGRPAGGHLHLLLRRPRRRAPAAQGLRLRDRPARPAGRPRSRSTGKHLVDAKPGEPRRRLRQLRRLRPHRAATRRRDGARGDRRPAVPRQGHHAGRGQRRATSRSATPTASTRSTTSSAPCAKASYQYIRSYQPYNPDGLQNNYRYKMLAYEEWRAAVSRPAS